MLPMELVYLMFQATPECCFMTSKVQHVTVTLSFISGKRVLEEEIKDIKSVSDSLQKELATCKTQDHNYYFYFNLHAIYLLYLLYVPVADMQSKTQ